MTTDGKLMTFTVADPKFKVAKIIIKEQQKKSQFLYCVSSFSALIYDFSYFHIIVLFFDVFFGHLSQKFIRR